MNMIDYAETVQARYDAKEAERIEARNLKAEEWWANQAAVMAVRMKAGGIASFRVTLNDRGKYDFEVLPTDA